MANLTNSAYALDGKEQISLILMTPTMKGQATMEIISLMRAIAIARAAVMMKSRIAMKNLATKAQEFPLK